MGKIHSSKKNKTPNRSVTWDDLIQIAEEQLGRNMLKTQQLEALSRYFRSRRDVGEPCPIQVQG